MKTFMDGPNIALVGDHQPEVTAHQGIQASLEQLRPEVPGLRWTWVATDSIQDAPAQLAGFSAVWGIPDGKVHAVVRAFVEAARP